MNVAPYTIIGDDGPTIPVPFLNTDGTARPLGTSEVPGVEFYDGTANATYDLTAYFAMTGPAAGVVIVPTSIVAGILPQVPELWEAADYPVRLRGFITDSLGNRKTYSVTPILVVDWRTATLAQLLPDTTIIAVVGPAGPPGSEAGPAQSIVDAIIFG